MHKDTTPSAISLAGTPADRVAAVYRCQRQFEELAATDAPDVKYCDSCQQKVFRVYDFDGLEQAIASRICVWGSVELPTIGREALFLGGPVAEYKGGSSAGLAWDDEGI